MLSSRRAAPVSSLDLALSETCTLCAYEHHVIPQTPVDSDMESHMPKGISERGSKVRLRGLRMDERVYFKLLINFKLELRPPQNNWYSVLRPLRTNQN